MNEEPFIEQFQAIHAQIAALHGYMDSLPPEQQEQMEEIWDAIAFTLDSLQLTYERMQTSLEVSKVIEEELLLQSQQGIAQHQRYNDLFQFAPDAALLTDANGAILEANQAAARLLNVPQDYLLGKPLAIFVPQVERQHFYSYLKQLAQGEGVQNWEINISPRNGKPFAAQLKVAIARDAFGNSAAWRMGIRDISLYKQTVTQPLPLLEQQPEALTPEEMTPVASLPQSLDGLQVLIVDDEADAREFITAVLESYGIRVTAVATAQAALAALGQFRFDVLVSDIRMPDENGYSLIRQIRELEAKQGWHIPAAALTAYLAEDREKALAAGFEAHLHKLAQPTELIAMVTQLARKE